MDDEVARRQAFEDVARDDAPKCPRTTDADGPEELAVRDEGQPVRAAGEAAVEAAIDEGDGPGRRGGLDPLEDRDRSSGLPEELHEPRRLVRGEDDPRTVRPPALDRVDDACRPTERQDGLPPPEEVARRQRPAGHRAALGRLRLPRELERPRRHEATLPVAARQVRRRPVLRQIAGRDQFRPPLVGLAPEELGSLGDVAGLVEDDKRAGFEVVETGRRGQLRGPDLGRIPHRHRPRLAGGQRRSQVVRFALEPGQVGGQSFGQAGGGPAQPLADRGHAHGWQQELRRGKEDRLVDGPDRALVGRVEGTQRIDLVAEELDPDRERQRRREHIDDAASTGELAPTGDLADRGIPELEQFAEQRVLVQPGTRPQPARFGGQVAGRDGVLEKGLDARDHDPGPAAPPRRQGRHPGGRLVGHELASLVGERGPWFEDRHCVRIAEPRTQLLGDPVPDLRVTGDPQEPLAGPCLGQGRREVGLRAMRDRDQPDMPADPPTILVRPTESFEQRSECPGLDEERRQGRQVRQAMSATNPGLGPGLGPGGLARPLGLGASLGRLEIPDLGVHLGDIEVDVGRSVGRAAERVAGGELLGDLLGDPSIAAAPTAQGRRGRLRHRCRPSAAGPAASQSGSCARRRGQAARRSRRARRAGRHRPAGARTC